MIFKWIIGAGVCGLVDFLNGNSGYLLKHKGKVSFPYLMGSFL